MLLTKASFKIFHHNVTNRFVQVTTATAISIHVSRKGKVRVAIYLPISSVRTHPVDCSRVQSTQEALAACRCKIEIWRSHFRVRTQAGDVVRVAKDVTDTGRLLACGMLGWL